MPSPDAPLGIFDSGVGGLTVFRRIAERLPNESIIYLGDTARVPYGTKSSDTVARYASACAEVLMDRGIKMLVVACNTASAYALDVLRRNLHIPVIGVIEPGAKRAVSATRNGTIGVIGTAGTIRSGQYQAVIKEYSSNARVLAKPCPMFVPLAEEGWLEGDVPLKVAQTYLAGLCSEGIDTLVLGCTHYPLLKTVIAEAVGPGVTLVDSAEATAESVADVLRVQKQQNSGLTGRSHRFLVTDAPETFSRVGKTFLSSEIETVEWVDI
ncbi:MAG TPA: glutamate racemase [Candidatus Hydrogenedentes bacterium]|nr:glutamate racemase [Candidatus Hydrogenedentota bacterium]HRK33618.1 glutamate racemase [Candidatus Hydrogenedentota bacterium]